MKVMALDYGAKRIGIAVSDELRLIARPLTTLRRNGFKFAQILERLARLIIEHEVGTLVVGLPLNLDGTRGPSASRVESFVALLKSNLSLPIVTIDECLTSIEADQWLRAQGFEKHERDRRSDEYAAMLILRDYLLSLPTKSEEAR